MNTAVTKLSLNFPKRRGEYLVFALPQNNHYHTVSGFSFTPGRCKHKIISNNRWGNKIAIFTLNDVVKEVKIDFQIKLKPYFHTINNNYKINDYSKNIFFPNRFINGQDLKIIKMAKEVVGKEKI